MMNVVIDDFAGRKAATSPRRLLSPLDKPPARSRLPAALGSFAALLVHGLVALGVFTVAAMPAARSVASLPLLAELIPVDVVPEPIPPRADPEPVRAPLAPMPKPRTAASAEAAPAPPAPARAAQVLSQAPAPDLLDFGDTFVQGNATSYVGGISEATGTSARAVRDVRARKGGVEGGNGASRGGVDRSRPPSLAGGAQWDCPFPEEADFAGIDSAAVTLQVRVSPTGQVESVMVVRDPGNGFGREARRCAMRKRWQPGLDPSGSATASLSVVNVRFTR
jgi:periplasmic protein TonB